MFTDRLCVLRCPNHYDLHLDNSSAIRFVQHSEAIALKLLHAMHHGQDSPQEDELLIVDLEASAIPTRQMLLDACSV